MAKLITGLCACAALSTAARTVSIGTYVANPGQTVEVPVCLNDAKGLTSIAVKLAYESTVLEFVGALPGDLETAFSDDFTVSSSLGKLSVGLYAAGDVAQELAGTVALLRFKVRDNTGGLFSDLTFSDVQISEVSGVKDTTRANPVSTINGMIRSVPSTADVTRLEDRQYLSAGATVRKLTLSEDDGVVASTNDAAATVCEEIYSTGGAAVLVTPPASAWDNGTYWLLKAPLTGLAFDLRQLPETVTRSYSSEEVGGFVSYKVTLSGLTEPIVVKDDDQERGRPEPAVTNTVTFVLGEHGDRVGGGALVQRVAQGDDAEEPTVVGLYDWVFKGWSAAFTNVQSDLVVTAQYDPPSRPQPGPSEPTVTNTVTFALGEHGERTGGGELVQRIAEGEDADEPEVEGLDGYSFRGWDIEFTDVRSNLTVTAQYDPPLPPPDVDTPEEVVYGGAPGEPMSIVLKTSDGSSAKWSAKNLPKGLKLDAKTGVISGSPTVPGIYAVTVTAKGTKTETVDIVITVDNVTDDELPLEDIYGAYLVGAKTLLDFTEFSDCKVTGLPSGLKFATKRLTDKNFGEIEPGTVYGVPTKACTNAVTFTRTVGGVKHVATAIFKVVALPAWAVGSFNGRLDDGSGAATMTVGATGKISGKVTLNGKSCSFSASGYEPIDDEGESVECLTVEAMVKSGRDAYPVLIDVAADGITGVLSDPAADEGRLMTLWRNAWKDKGATDLIAGYVGTYAVQLSSRDTGYGYLSLTVDGKGTCKVTGKLPDGTSASGSLPLVWDDMLEELFAVWQLAPSAYKGGAVGGLLSIDAGRSVFAEEIAWASQAPTATDVYGEGFVRTIAAAGAWYNKLEALGAHYTSLTFVADQPELDVTIKYTDYDANLRKATTSERTTVQASDLDCWNGLTISVDGKGTGFVVDAGKATKPSQDKETKGWSYEGVNDAALSLSFTKATGIFKGSFTCWYDYVSSSDSTKDENGDKTAHASKKVKFEGVMTVPGEPLRGFFLWDRQGVYEDAKSGAQKTFKYKESHPIVFE